MIQELNNDELMNLSGRVLRKALFEMSQNKAEQDLQILTNILATDLRTKFKTLSHQDVEKAFHEGVRYGEQMAINPRTWFKWLNDVKKKVNLKKIKQNQENEKLMIENKNAQTDKQKTFREFIELCLIEVYEEYLETRKASFRGLNIIFPFLEQNGYIVMDNDEKEMIFEQICHNIKNRMKFVGNEKKEYYPVSECREYVMLQTFEEWEKNKIDVRKSILDTLDEIEKKESK